MNSAYLYNPQEASCAITNRIYYLLENRHWSVKTLSDESNIPYETLKKLLSRKTENTSFHNIMKIALAFNCNLNDLLAVPETASVFPGYLSDVETSLDFCNQVPETYKIPVLTPYTLLNQVISEYPYTDKAVDSLTLPLHELPDVEYGLQISSFCYHPVYQCGDILLVSRKRPPLQGETGIFLHRDKIYIRIFYRNNSSILLKSVNGLGPDIKINNFTSWNMIGYVVGIQRIR